MANSKVELDTESRTYLEYAKTAGPLDLTKSVDSIRQLTEQAVLKLKGDYIFAGAKAEHLISNVKSEDDKHQVPVTVLKPKESGQPPKSILIYFHGGGWVWSNRNTHMKFCEMVSQESNSVVVNVEYRLSPEHKFPACNIDAEAVARWCLDNKMSLAGNNSALVGVGGDSAGGNIAASVCHVVQGLDFQVLIYPSLDLADRTAYPSYEKYSEGYLLTSQLMAWFYDQYLVTEEDAQNPLCSPMKRDSFTGLPPALLIVSEVDPLADQGSVYRKKLEEAGVNTDFVLLKGTVHGFVTKPGHFKETVRKTVKHISEFLSSL